MPEIEDELNIDIDCKGIRVITCGTSTDKIIINGLELTQAQAGCLVYLTSNPPGTMLNLELKVAT